MTAVSFRYDFAEDEQGMNPCAVISRFLREYYPGIVGIESHNKYGEVIKRHMHYHFYFQGDEKETKKFIERTRKHIQRHYQEIGERGKGFYSLTAPDVQDTDRWLRYCLKQVPTVSETFSNPRIKVPDGFDLEFQWMLATEEYQRDREFLSSRRETADKRQTTYQKILASIQDSATKFRDVRHIFDYIIDYYKQEELPVERHKIRSMIDTIALSVGLLSYDEYYRQVMA